MSHRRWDDQGKFLLVVPRSGVQPLPSTSPDPYQREARLHRDEIRMGPVLWGHTPVGELGSVAFVSHVLLHHEHLFWGSCSPLTLLPAVLNTPVNMSFLFQAVARRVLNVHLLYF